MPPASAGGVPCTVEVRGQGHALLRALVQEGLPSVRAALADAGLDLPRHVEREFAGFEACGQPEHGYAWLLCRPCEHHRLVTFSCKGRGFCPSCGGRRMAERAAWWVDRVFPRVGVRQWVLTVPWSRRWLLARRTELARGVLRIALDAVERWYRKKAGRKEARGGSITVLQRFGSALNLNLHFHALVLDGTFVPTRRCGVSFRRATPPCQGERDTRSRPVY